MSQAVELYRLDRLNETEISNLSALLVDVVDDGASIGFLAPLRFQEAESYWTSVMEPGVSLWIATMNGQIVGTIQLHLAMKANAMHRAEICKLMVHPVSRRRGIARKLMLEAEQAARELGRTLIVLDTRAGDPSNLLYRSLEYKEAGRIPGYAQSSDGSYDDTMYYYKQLYP